MAEVFTNYPDISDTASESTDKAESQPTQNKKLIKALKKAIKQLKKQNKLVKQYRERRAVEEMPIEEQSAVNKEDRPKTTGKEEKPFLTKLGDVFLKALPGILTTAVSALIAALFGRSFKRTRSPMGAMA